MLSERSAVRVGAVAWIAAAAGYFVAEAVAATAVPGYGYRSDYISTLADPVRSPRAGLVNAAFLAQSVLFPVGARLVARNVRSRRPFLGVVLGNGVGNLMVAGVHSGSGSAWHAVGAATAIVGGNVAVVVGASAVGLPAACRRPSAVLGVSGLLCLAAVGVGAQPVGTWERAAVYSIFAWQTAAAVLLLRGGRRSPR